MLSLPSPPRTNSLAFAKTDCHTCAARRRRCDRKRPRCSSCFDKSIVCGGYVMQLTWPKSRSTQQSIVTASEQAYDPFYLEPLSHLASIRIGDKNGRCRPQKPRKFRFVLEKFPSGKQVSAQSFEAPVIQRSAHTSKTQTWDSFQRGNIIKDISTVQFTPSSPLLSSFGDGFHTDGPCLSNEQTSISDPFANFIPIDLSSNLLDWSSWSPPSTIDVENSDTLGELDKDCGVASMSLSLEKSAREHRSPTVMCRGPMQNSMPFSSPVLHKNLHGKFESLLNMYDEDFCVMPLSRDTPCNPFRCRSGTSRGSQSLLHAILAVACYHAGRKAINDGSPPSDVVDHQKTAIKLYRNELDTCTKTQGLQLLDTTMVLFLSYAAESAFGNWATHISDARELLESSGGIEIWIPNRRVQAQVVMLLWWDATIALLSRQGCLLPYSYLEALLAVEDNQYWSFFDLIGCPRELVVPLIQLACLAEENEKASSMKWTKFDLTLVDEIQTSIVHYKNHVLEIDDDMSEEQMQQHRDRWNCTEAWRYGLLLYITRVFRWNRKSSPPTRLTIYARLVIEHVHSCRHTAILQKQAFLPLFFAGCETKDQFSRQSIRDYCQYWGKVCGYNLFSSASALLEDVWMEQDGPRGDEAWWGSVIDKKGQPYQSQVAPMQFCFG